MKNWLLNRSNQGILAIIILTASIYRHSFVSPFFQDDKLLLTLAKKNILFSIIPNFPFRPVSINWFYGLSQSIFGLNVVGFHWLLFLFFALSLFLFYELANKLLRNNFVALVAVFFYAINISIFANFFWIATSYFVLGTFFIFLTIHFSLRSGRANFTCLIVSFLLALGSIELAFLLPLLIILINSVLHEWKRNALILLLLDGTLLLVRMFLIGFPKASDYSLQFDLQALATIKWYLIRALNLPEGIKNGHNTDIYWAFFLWLGILSIAAVFSWKEIFKNVRLFLFALLWFLISALPFYFLPNHMSSYYLTLALFGPALIYALVLSKTKRLLAISLILYLYLTISGLEFLSRSHWIILKSN